MAEQSVWDKPYDEVTWAEFKGQIKKDSRKLFIEFLNDMGDTLLSDYTNEISVYVGMSIKQKAVELGLKTEEVKEKYAKEIKTDGKEYNREALVHYMNKVSDKESQMVYGARTQHPSFFSRLSYDFPDTRLPVLNTADAAKELNRAMHIVKAIARANGLDVPNIELNTKVHSASIGKDNSSSDDYVLYINPLQTKHMTNNQFAFVIGHELAHVACHHPEEQNIMRFSSIEVDAGLRIKKSDTSFLKSLESMHEYEADKFGCLFATKAGFKKVNDLTFLLEGEAVDKVSAVFTELNVTDVHPSPSERSLFLKNLNLDELTFNRESYDSYIDSLQNKYKMAEDLRWEKKNDVALSLYLDVEQTCAKKALPFVKMADRCFSERLQALHTASVEDKMKMMPFLDFLKDVQYKNKVDDTIPQHRVVLNNLFAEKVNNLAKHADEIVHSVSKTDRLLFTAKKLLRNRKALLQEGKHTLENLRG